MDKRKHKHAGAPEHVMAQGPIRVKQALNIIKMSEPHTARGTYHIYYKITQVLMLDTIIGPTILLHSE